MGPGPRRTVVVALAAALAALAVPALLADLSMYGRSWYVVGDVAVGLAFPLAAVLARGPFAQRVLVALVGLAWLAGSIWGVAVVLHQGVVIAMLGAYPSGRLRKPVPLAIAAAGLAVAVAIPGPLVTAVVLLAEAGTLLVLDFVGPVRQRGYAVVSAFVLAATLLQAAWLTAQGRVHEPGVYQAAMAAVAVGYPVATWLAAGTSRALRDRIVGDEVAGVQRLASVLAALLRDPDLAIDEPPSGDTVQGRDVRLDGEVVAVIRSGSPLLADPGIGEAVDESVRLVVRQQRLREADEARSRDLERARRRLLLAVDQERADAATQLAERVGRPVAAALERLGTMASPPMGVTDSLRDVDSEVAGIVGGTPPADLETVGLAGAVEALARQSPVPTTVTIGMQTPDAEVATAVFYVCREALTNAAKHSGATGIAIDLDRTSDALRLTIADDGRGGADAAGSGLTGLADRVATIGGQLTVVSPPGGGTRLEVRMPR